MHDKSDVIFVRFRLSRALAYKMIEDAELLRRYAANQSESAFTELVQRYVNLVFSTAFRVINDGTHRAEDVTQQVFSELARNAKRLAQHSSLTGWLYTTTRRMALRSIRADQRRRAREQEAGFMNEILHETAPQPDWDKLRPVLENAMHELGEKDRLAVLLRYFENKNLKEVGAVLNLNENAARMRVDRALEKLRLKLTRKGVTFTTATLAVTLVGNAVIAAPFRFVDELGSSSLAIAASEMAAQHSVLKIMSMISIKNAIVPAALAVLVGTGLYEARQISIARTRIESLQSRQAPLIEQVQRLQRQRDDISNRLAMSLEENERRDQNSAELLRLRGEVTRLRKNANELAQAKTATSRVNHPRANEMLAYGLLEEKRSATNSDLKTIEALKITLGLTPDQERAIRDILFSKIEPHSKLIFENAGVILSDSERDAIKTSLASTESEIAALLTPEQQAAYYQFINDEIDDNRKNFATREASEMKKSLNLSARQEEEVIAALSDLQPGKGGIGHATGLSDAKGQLEARLRALDTILSTEQQEAYRKQKWDKIQKRIETEKMFKNWFGTAATGE